MTRRRMTDFSGIRCMLIDTPKKFIDAWYSTNKRPCTICPIECDARSDEYIDKTREVRDVISQSMDNEV